MAMVTETRTVKLVRRRDGVDAYGREVGDTVGMRALPHLVDVTADLDSPDGVTACCGAGFAPGVLVEMAWIEELPHKRCLQGSSWPRARIEADFQAASVESGVEVLSAEVAADALAILGVIPEVAASIAEVGRVVGDRYGWVQEVGGVPAWEYYRSFGGVLASETRTLSHLKLGVTPLTVAVVAPGFVRVLSCGVLGGCPEHAMRTEDRALDGVAVLREWLTEAEKHARAVDLYRLCQCLLIGPCSTSSPTRSGV